MENSNPTNHISEESKGIHLFSDDKNEYPVVIKYHYYWLLILPFIYCCLWLYCFYQSKTFYTTYPDSIYIYLINGTNIASGNLDIGHYDNPGTPVHIFGGIIIYLVHLFSGKGIVYEDVLVNTEYYLRFCASVFAAVLLLSTFLSGRLVLKHTGNLFLALCFQLLPICSFFTIHYLLLVRMCPEDLLIAVLAYYFAFLWVLCYKRDYFPKSAFSRKSHLLFFSFISALLVTTKMTCLPFLIVPFFFIKKWSKKFIYVIATGIIGLFLMYPIWPKFPDMYVWFTRLATHSGEYGQGKEGVSVSVLGANLIKLFQHEYFFTGGYFLFLIILVVGAIKKRHSENLYKLIVAFLIVSSAQLMLASKQFGYHYLIASQMLMIPGLIAVFYFWKRAAPSAQLIRIFFISCLVFFGYKVSLGVSLYTGGNKMHESSENAVKYNNVPKIITTGYQGACFVESGIRFGASYGGRYYHKTNYYLRKQYPNSYFFDMHLPENTIKKWDIIESSAQFFEDKPKVIVYFVQMSKGEESAVIQRITSEVAPAIKNISLIEENKETGEHFYLIEVDTIKSKLKYIEQAQWNYNFETLNKENAAFVSTDGQAFIGEASTASEEKYFSGTHAAKLVPGQYTCCSTYEAYPGDLFDISVKYYSSDRPVGITLSSQTPGTFDRNCETITEENGNGWRTVNLKALVPGDFNQGSLNFCLYYFGFNSCYVDDLKITIKRSAFHEEQKVLSALKEVKHFILKAKDGKFISVGSDALLIANQANIRDATVFEKIELPDGMVAIKAPNGKYLCDDRNQGSRIFANRSKQGGWESFLILGDSLSSIQIKSSSGKFICSDHSTDDKLVADKQKASTWETFELIKK